MMGESQPPGRVYSAHREKQRRHILATAQTLFDQHGIERVTMADIIAASGLMRSTIYQYFANKDEMIWALVQESMEYSNALRQQILHDPPGSALATRPSTTSRKSPFPIRCSCPWPCRWQRCFRAY